MVYKEIEAFLENLQKKIKEKGEIKYKEDFKEKLLQSDFYSDIKGFVIALSGGLDSVVLLYALSRFLKNTKSKFTIRAIHVNHNLSQNSYKWEEHCKDLCREYNVALDCYSVSVKRLNRQSLEDLARQKRYRVLTKYLKKGEVLLTAHHQRDVAETTLLQLMRGSGVAGLAGIANEKILKFEGTQALVMRPLLNLEYKEVAQYARDNKLGWVEDESNLNIKFKRNYIRHKILPGLEVGFAGALSCIARSAKHCANANRLEIEIAQQDLSSVRVSPMAIDLVKFRNLSSLRQANLLRYFLKINDILAPSTSMLEEFIRQICEAAGDKLPSLSLHNKILRVWQNKLCLCTADIDQDEFLSINIIWDISKVPELELPDDSILYIERMEGLASNDSQKASDRRLRNCIIAVKGDLLKIRYKTTGTRMECAEDNLDLSAHKLKKLFSNAGIPPWLRFSVPFVYEDDKLLSIADLASSHANTNKKNELVKLYKISWEYACSELAKFATI